MLWTSSQQTVIDQFIQEIKTIGWFKQVGEPSEKYWVIDTIWEACDTYGHQMLEVWGQNSELIEQKALRQLRRHIRGSQSGYWQRSLRSFMRPGG